MKKNLVALLGVLAASVLWTNSCTAGSVGLKYLGSGKYGASMDAAAGMVSNNMAVIASGMNGLLIFDISALPSAKLLGKAENSLWGTLDASDVKLSGQYAFVAARRNGLENFDLSAPAQPVRVGGYRLSGDSKKLVLSTGYAYLAAGDGGMQVVDIRTPTFTSLAGRFPRDLGDSLTALDLQVRSNFVYVAGAEDGLVILKTSNIENITVASKLKLGGSATTIALSGTSAYVSTAEGLLNVVDISNPAAPKAVGSYPVQIGASVKPGLSLSDNLAYIAAGTHGLRILDVTVPANITEVGNIITGGSIQGVTAIGNLILVTESRMGFILMQPVVGGGSLPAVQVEPLNQTAAENTTAQFKVTVPTMNNPSYQWMFEGAPLAKQTQNILSLSNITAAQMGNYSVWVTGDGGSVLSRESTLQVLPLPKITEQPSDLTLAENRAGSLIVTAITQGTVWYQWRFNGQNIPDATNSFVRFDAIQPAQAGSYDVVVSNNVGSVVSRSALVTVIPKMELPPQILSQPDDLLTVENESSSLSIKAGPEGPFKYQWYFGSQPIPGATNASLSFAGIKQSQAGTYWVEVSNSAGSVSSRKALVTVRPKIGLQFIGKWPQSLSGKEAVSVKVVENLAYVCTGSAGVQILDITTVTNPVWIGTIGSRGYSSHVEIVGTRAYVADGTYGGLQIHDISNPAKPVRLGSYALQQQVNDVKVSGFLAYLVTGEGGLVIMDVTDPAQPAIRGKVSVSFNGLALDVAGMYAYVAAGLGGMKVIDISNPEKPMQVSEYRPGIYIDYSARGVRVLGNYAYVSSAYDGLIILDVSDPTHPVSVGSVDTTFSVSAHVKNSIVYLADLDGGIDVFDLANAGKPLRVGSWSASGQESYSIDSWGDYLLVANGVDGLMILKSSSGVISSPCSLTLLQSSNKREIRWHVSGGGNGPAIVLKSDDLIRWTSFWTNSAPTADDFEFTVDTTGGKPAAFFRVVK